MGKINHNEAAMVSYFMDNFDTDRDFSTGKESVEEACAITLKDFMRVTEYPANLHNIPQLVDRVADHLLGLPSPFHVEIYYSDIEQQLRDWGVLKESASNSTVQRMKDNYHRYWANWIIQKAKKFKA